MSGMKTIQANKSKNNNNLYTYTFDENGKVFKEMYKNNMFIKEKRVQSSYNLFLCICIDSQ